MTNCKNTMVIVADIRDRLIIIISATVKYDTKKRQTIYKIITRKEDMKYLMKINKYIQDYLINEIITLSTISQNNLCIDTKSITAHSILNACMLLLVNILRVKESSKIILKKM